MSVASNKPVPVMSEHAGMPLMVLVIYSSIHTGEKEESGIMRKEIKTN
jgi:hypothetical protein